MLSQNSPFYQAHCISCRLPMSVCPCDELKQQSLPFDIVLCTHSNEWQRQTNTGQWVILSNNPSKSPSNNISTSPNSNTDSKANNVQRLKWQRKWPNDCPPNTKSGDYLLFPAKDAQLIDIEAVAPFEATTQNQPAIERLWLLDGTWQEANKMLRQSPWLQQLPKVALHLTRINSHYELRRNQKGVCTLESLALTLEALDPSLDTSALWFNFHLLQQRLTSLS